MRYISDNVISFSMVIEPGKGSARISFTANSNGGSSYYTDSEAVIKAMEASPMFGVVYRRASECIDEQVGQKKKAVRKAKEEPKLTPVNEVTGWQDAIEYLVSNCESDASKLSSPEAILKEAATKNIWFPNLNN